jgi:hypothetical protein
LRIDGSKPCDRELPPQLQHKGVGVHQNAIGLKAATRKASSETASLCVKKPMLSERVMSV